MPAGRPSLYRADYHPALAHKLALLMATDEEIADAFSITAKSLYEWKAKFPALREAIARGGITADAEVAAKLRHRALGYNHQAVKIFMPQGATEPVYAEYTEHYPPDTNAASLWLRNRQRGRWRDKIEMEGSLTHVWGDLIVDAIEAEAAPLTIEHEPAQAHVAPPKKKRAKPVVRRTLKPRKAK